MFRYTVTVCMSVVNFQEDPAFPRVPSSLPPSYNLIRFVSPVQRPACILILMHVHGQSFPTYSQSCIQTWRQCGRELLSIVCTVHSVYVCGMSCTTRMLVLGPGGRLVVNGANDPGVATFEMVQ